MLWKYFQNCVHRENWKINPRICHTVPRFNPYLVTISLKLKVLFQCRSEITLPTIYGPVTCFPFVWWGKVNRTDSSTKVFSLFAHFSSISAAICLLLKRFYQDNNFFFWNLFFHFRHPARPAPSRNFCYCNVI